MGCGATFAPSFSLFKNEQQQFESGLSESNKQNKQQVPTQKIKICTINLGSEVSPFSYYLQNHSLCCNKTIIHNKTQEYLLSICFQSIFSKLYVFSEKDKQESKNIQEMLYKLQQITTKRYTPLYHERVGSTPDYFLMERKQFQEKWKQQFQKIYENSEINQINQKFVHFCQNVRHLVPLLKKHLMKFDLICYYAILLYLYDDKINENMNRHEIQIQIAQLIKKNRSQKYCKYLSDKFKISLFDLETRICKLVSFIKKKSIDIVFLQEVNLASLKMLDYYIQNYRFCGSTNKKSNCAILIKSSLMKKLQPKMKCLSLQQLNRRYIKQVKQIKSPRSLPIDVQNKSYENEFSNKRKNQTQKNYSSHNVNLNQTTQSTARKFSGDIPQVNSLNEDRKKIKVQSQITNKTIIPFKLPPIKNSLSMVQNMVESAQKNILDTPFPNKFRKQLLKSPKQNNKIQNNQCDKISEKSEQFYGSEQILSKNFITSLLTQIYVGQKNKITNSQLQQISMQENQADAIIQFIGCLILVSVQLNQTKHNTNLQKSGYSSSSLSKQSKSKSPIQCLKTILKKLRQKFPSHYIIVGTRIQSTKSIKKDQIIDYMKKFRSKSNQQIYFIPNIHQAISNISYQQRHLVPKRNLKKMVQKRGLYTTLRRRSNFNIYRKLVNIQQIGSACFLLSNNRIDEFGSYACNGQKINQYSQFTANKKYLPSSEHPFEDFFVYGEINVRLKQVIFKTKQEN